MKIIQYEKLLTNHIRTSPNFPPFALIYLSSYLILCLDTWKCLVKQWGKNRLRNPVQRYPLRQTREKRVDPSIREIKNRPVPPIVNWSTSKGWFHTEVEPTVFIHTRCIADHCVHLEIIEWQPRWNFLGEEFRSLLDTVQECSSLSRVWHNGEIQSTALLYQYSSTSSPLPSLYVIVQSNDYLLSVNM